MKTPFAHRLPFLAVGAAILISTSKAQADWVAFIDHLRGAGTSNHTLVVNWPGDATGKSYALTNIATGQTIAGPGMAMTKGGGLGGGAATGTPNAGTPAASLFGGYVNWVPASGNKAVQLQASTVFTLSFTNLDLTKRYSFAGTAVRGEAYPHRWTVGTLLEAASFQDAHTPGCIVGGDSRITPNLLTNGQAIFNSGSNNLVGDVLVWTNISPSPAGRFSVELRRWGGPFPDGTTTPDSYAFMLTAIRLEESSVAGPPQILAPLRDQTNLVGTVATFTVSAVGSEPLAYFWFTNQVLAVAGQAAGFTGGPLVAGSNFVCRVIVSNAFGTVTNEAVAWGEVPILSVDLAAPASGQAFAAPAVVPLAANVSGGVCGGVGFYAANTGNTWLGTALASPYSASSPGLAVGMYAVYAVATNAVGTAYYSSTNGIAVTNVPMVVTLLSPGNGQVFGTPATVILQANASGGSGGAITGVGFFSTNAGWLASALTSPYSNRITLAQTNPYGVYAVATNLLGLTAFSATNLITVSGADLDSGLIAHWAMNETAGLTAADSSGHNDHGTLTAGPVWTSGKFGGGLRFDGVDDFVDVPDGPVLNPTSALTLAVWFKSANVAAGAMLICKGNSGTQYNLREFQNSVRFRVSAGSGLTDLEVTYPFTNGGWYHVAGVYDGSTMRVFVNASQVGTSLAKTGALLSDTVGLALGKRSGANNNFFNGILDDARIYARALSVAELTALFNAADDRAWDFGDAPDPTYPTRLASDGARHVVGLLHLGAGVDPEPDGHPSAGAIGDDTDANGDDEDGVVFTTPIARGASDAGLDVTASLPCRLDAWVDFDGNGSWGDPGEQIFASTPLAAGTNSLTFAVPAAAKLGPTYARFRVSTAGGLLPTGPANDGEVEDYQVQIEVPVTNAVAPTIAGVVPAAGTTLSGLSTLQITFSEAVAGVEAADLLVNGVLATGMSGSGRTYTFAVAQPTFGTVTITWVAGHGIHDLGSPSLPFDASAPGATWSYTLLDTTAPTVAAKNPPAGATVTNLVQVTVTFSEPVTGVEASDLLVNGAPAVGLSGGGSNYAFSFSQPSAGVVNISWAANHGITDLAVPPNGFNAGAAGATWSYTLDARTILVESNSSWRYYKGYTEASAPLEAWRQLSFDDSAWSNSLAPFYYGDSGYTNVANPGTPVPDMANNAYTCVFLRHAFTVANAAALTNLYLVAQSDDGFIAWINGTEVYRYNMPGVTIAYNGGAVQAAPEPSGNGPAYLSYTLPNANTYLVEGSNLLSVQAFNVVSQPASSDFGLNAQLYTFQVDARVTAPRLLAVNPPAGSLFALSNVVVTFSEAVGGVDAGDLLVNGVPAAVVTGGPSNRSYSFGFAQPAYGPVAFSWAAGHGIVDFDPVPKPFDGTAAGSTWQSLLLNPNAPTVAAQTPSAGATVSHLTQLTVTFSKPVTHLEAADLLVNGVPASSVSGGGATYLFTFPQPAYGAVSVGWAPGHGIEDLDVPPNPFDPARVGSTWSYTLVDQTPPAVATQNPPAGAQVTNLTQLTVTFSEAVSGVDAGDLLINGSPANTVSGSGAAYTFSFAQPNATLVTVTWAPAHGIRDLATTPNVFNAAAPGATWFYLTPDNVPPTLVSLSPPADATVRSLLQISLLFSEPVTGVNTNDLLLNGQPARQVTGAGAGPYTFAFAQPSNGPVVVRWAAGHGITDLATPPNPFGGDQWTYLIDPDASYADKILFNEIMFNPPSGRVADEWLELHNVSSDLVNLAGWRLTRGLEFTFPNVSIPAGGYLVVAADVATFQQKYPDVTNVVGGWAGRLADNGETLEITTALGEVVNRTQYASEGDWARRERGRGARLVESITRSGSTATVTLFGHNFTANDRVLLSGATQSEYNGFFTVSSPSSATFTIAVPGTPATPATGRIICRLVTDNSASGWSWFCAADGFGSSLELVNPALPNDLGQNWLSSLIPDGTPGRANSVLSNTVAPFLAEVTHFPPVPRSTNSVTISARVWDQQSNGVQSVTLFYRNHGTTTPPAFSSVAMFDDGAHDDGAAHDGLYAATLAPQANRAVIEFYVQALGTSGLTRTWPAPTWETNNTFAQLANALYQVDDESSATNMPFLRVIMTESERSQLNAIDTASDAEMNATFLSLDGDGPQVRYNAGVRLRGAGSRSGTPKNYRVNVPNDHLWNGRSRFNLNSRYAHAQLAGSVLSQRAGLPSADARVVQVRINGQNLASAISFGCYVLVEPMNGDWAANHFPLDPDGNVYRGSKYPWNANLDYLGTNAATYQGQTGAGYYKASNGGENDWTDLFRLTSVLSTGLADADYLTAVRTNVNVEEWLLYFLVCNFFDYQETSLCVGVGDDYAMYRGVVDPRFRLVAHDFDTILNQGDTAGSTTRSIWSMVDTPRSTDTTQRANFLSRFMRFPEFGPSYFRLWKQQLETTFSPAQLNPLLDEVLGGWVTGTAVSDMKTFAANRRAYILTQIPTNLTVSSTLSTQSGYLYTTTPNVTLFGQAHIIDTRRVLVNGTASTWSAWQGRWTNTVTLQPGVNRVLVQSLDSNSLAFASAMVDIWYDDGTVQTVSGAISADTVWTAAGGPYNVSGSLTINSGATLTIQAGTTLYLGSGVNVTVASGGRLLAEGTATAPIRFSRTPGTSTSWGGITINGGAGSPETRIAYAHLEFNGSTALHSTGGTVFLDHLTFGNSAVQYLSLDSSSFVVQDCLFPPTTASFEPVHGTGGIKTGGRGLFLRNFWGRLTGYNDACDFTGGNRPGPIVQFIHNVFMGSDDDLLDLDSTDAWVEGNIFMHTHRNGSPDSSSAVSGGADNADTSQVTLLGNLIYDCDQAALAKQGNFFTLLNNTIVHQNHTGSQDTNTAVVILADDSTTQGAGMYLEGNLIQDAENLTRNVTTALVTYTNNLIYGLAGAPWSGPGGGNRSADPLLKHVPAVTETTNFTTWAQAQVLWDWFSLKTGSPAVGTGPNGHDFGAPLQRVNTSTVEPLGGLSLSGEPIGSPPFTTATLRVAPLCTGNGLPTAGWPDGSGFTHYRWRLDAGVWSAETPTSVPITLTGLGAGPHYVEVVGQNDAGFYQDDPVFGPDALITVSRTWVVDPAASPLRLNEVLASNGGAVNHQGTTPDLIELHNASDVTQSLAGLRLTDDPLDPAKFIFPPGAVMGPREYLVLYANNPDGTPGYHLGFNLAQEGQAVWLYDAPERGGEVLDSVRFGPQLTDLSIGRLADGSWGLTVPTFGVPNQAAALGDPTHLLLNEWLALGVTPFNSDFLELYNADPLPVSLGGLFLSDEILGWRDRHALAPLSFIAGSGCLRFLADGAPSQGPTHLNFTLRSDQGVLGLYLPDLTPIDQITYLAQWPNVSQGRSPNAGTNIVFFAQPTPGAPNPLVTGPAPNGGVLVINEVLANNAGQVEAGRTPDWVELYNGATTNVSLGDLSLTDDTLQPRRFVFPAGTVLAPGAYLRVLCDPGTTNSGPLLNTNFALQSSGGGVYLFDAPAAGGSLLSAITYGLQVANLSIGRVPDGSTNWFLCSPTPTAANRSVTSLGNPANLKVNEWMAEPGPGKDDWFELYNPDPQPVALGGLYLTDDLNNRTKHLLAPLSFLGAGTNAWQQFLADGNTGAGADHVNFSLRAAGEALGLFTATGTLIDGVVFGAQQERISAGRFPDGAATLVSFPGTDSAGESNWRRLTNVVINEVLTHTDEPLEDAIELYNLTDQPVSLGGWWLSDDPSEPRKYQIPAATVLPAHGFTVIYETVFTNRETAAIPFALSSQGDEVVLSAYASNAFTGWRTRVDFGVAANGVSFGRYVTSDGREEFVPLSRQTFGVDDPATVAQFRTGQGLPNAYPRVGPIVISEIMYHPPDLGTNDNQRDEFIELHNPTAAPVPLYDPAYPTNVWRLRNAVDFDFPPGTVIPPGGYLLVVSFDPFLEPAALAAFRTNYALGTGVVLVGPYAGKLDNANETIELKRPDVPNTNEVPYLLVERVHYADAAPWPPAADGTGLSLQRLDAAAFGDDPANWVAAAPTPGPSAAPADSDGDGLPDAWESFYGLDPHNPNDAVLDSDGDHLTNWQEFRIGTDPRDPASALRLGIALAPGGTTVLLSFPAVAGVAYELEYAETLRVPWQVLRAFAPAPTNQLIQVETPATTTTFFRLRAQ